MLRVVMAAVEGAFRRRLSGDVNPVLMVLSAFYRVSVRFRFLFFVPPPFFYLLGRYRSRIRYSSSNVNRTLNVLLCFFAIALFSARISRQRR